MITKRILLFISSIFILGQTLSSQRISISLPDNANLNYALILNKGIAKDTIVRGKFDFAGNAKIILPNKDSSFVGIGELFITGKPIVNFVLNHENFGVKKGADNKYIFSESRENSYLYAYIQKEGQLPPIDTTLYADFFLNQIRYIRHLNKIVAQQPVNLREKAEVKYYALHQLNMQKLYTSGLWYYVIDGIMKLDGDQEAFGRNIVAVLNRIESQEVFEHLVGNLIIITDQYGWDDAFNIIIPYVQGTGRISTPTGRIYTAFTLAKLRKGMPAPNIEGLEKPLNELNADKILLFFYESDCHNCINEMAKLKVAYPTLKNKNIAVISISSDMEEDIFKEKMKDLPWKDKLCDLKGFAGKNFLNYGILGTPTFFVIDRENRIVGRYALLDDTGL